MKKRSGVSKRYSKDEITKRAKEGVFDRNPLLASTHELVCKSCGCRRKIIYLDYLKSGKYELGRTELVEVAYAAPSITGLGRAMERITPIIMRVKCKGCGTEISHSPVSLEYLLFTTRRRQDLAHMYV